MSAPTGQALRQATEADRARIGAARKGLTHDHRFTIQNGQPGFEDHAVCELCGMSLPKRLAPAPAVHPFVRLKIRTTRDSVEAVGPAREVLDLLARVVVRRATYAQEDGRGTACWEKGAIAPEEAR